MKFAEENAYYGLESDELARQSARKGIQVIRGNNVGTDYYGSFGGGMMNVIRGNKESAELPGLSINVSINQPFVENEAGMASLADKTAGRIKQTVLPDLQRLLGGGNYGY